MTPQPGAVARATLVVCVLGALGGPSQAQTPGSTELPANTLSHPQWTEDGRALVGIADEESRAPFFSAFDGASGRATWRLALDALRDPVRGKKLTVDRWQPSTVAGELLFESGGDLFLARANGKPMVTRLTQTKDREEGATLAPDGEWVAFARGGDLWAIELASRREQRLTSDGRPPALTNGAHLTPEAPLLAGGGGFAWAPESRTIAFLRREAGITHLATVNLITLDAQPLETGVPGEGRLEEVRWRFDAGALVVERRSTDGRALELLLCHPERRYCRKFAQRTVEAGAAPRRDLELFPDGFVWGSGARSSAALARYDTLGRQRFELAIDGWTVEALEYLDLDGSAVVLRASRTQEGGVVEQALFRLPLAPSSAPQMIANGGAENLVSPAGQALVAITTAPNGTRQRELRTLDGKLIASLPPPPAGK